MEKLKSRGKSTPPPPSSHENSPPPSGKKLKQGKTNCKFIHEYVDVLPDSSTRSSSIKDDEKRLPEDLFQGCELWDDFADEKWKSIERILDEKSQISIIIVFFNSLKTLKQVELKANRKSLKVLDSLEKAAKSEQNLIFLTKSEQMKRPLLESLSNEICLIHFSTPFKFKQEDAIPFHLKSSESLSIDNHRYNHRLYFISRLFGDTCTITNIHLSPNHLPNAFDHILRAVAGWEYAKKFDITDNAEEEWEKFSALYDAKDDLIPRFQLGRMGLKDDEDLKLMKKFKDLMKLADSAVKLSIGGKGSDKENAKVTQQQLSKEDEDNPFL